MGVADSALFVCYGLILAIGVVGNVLIVIFFGCKMKSLTSYRLFLIHLAITDCLCCITAPFIYMYESVTPKWKLGIISCKVLNIIPSVTITISAWILCGISYERYRAIVHPIHRRFSPSFVHGYCFLLWLLSIPVYIPHITNLTEQSGYCRIKYPSPVEALGFTLMCFAIQNIIPFLIMTFCFVNIYRVSRSHSKVPVQTLLISVVAFALCELPQVIFYMCALVIHLYFPEFDNPPVHSKVNMWLLLLLYSNTVMNCFIYAGKFRKFRIYIGKFFGGNSHIDKEFCNSTMATEV